MGLVLRVYRAPRAFRGLSAGTDVMTGERVDFSSEVLVGPRQVMIVEF